MKRNFLLLLLVLFGTLFSSSAQTQFTWTSWAFKEGLDTVRWYPLKGFFSSGEPCLGQYFMTPSRNSWLPAIKFFETLDWCRVVDTPVQFLNATNPPDTMSCNTDCILRLDSGKVLVKGTEHFPTVFYESTNDGLSWSEVSRFEQGITASVDFLRKDNKGVMIAMFYGGTMYRSIDKGKSWVLLPNRQEVYDGECEIVMSESGDVYAQMYMKKYSRSTRKLEQIMPFCISIHKSTDYGVSWTRVDTLHPAFRKRYYGNGTKTDWAAYDLQLLDTTLYFIATRREIIDGATSITTTRMLSLTPSGVIDTVCEQDFYFSNATKDVHGKLYANVVPLDPFYYIDPRKKLDSFFGSSKDNGRTWKVINANKYVDYTGNDSTFHQSRMVKNPFSNDSIQQLAFSDVQFVAANGRFYRPFSYFMGLNIEPGAHILGYYISDFKIPLAPTTVSKNRSCGEHWVTFTSDTLLSVAVEPEDSAAVSIDYRILKPEVSTIAHVKSLREDTTVFFTIRAKGVYGETVYRDSISPQYKVRQWRNADTLFVDGGNRAAYQWMLNGKPMAMQTLREDGQYNYHHNVAPFVVMKERGEYCCEVLDESSCLHTRVFCTTFSGTSSAEEESSVGFTIYPNPAQATATIYVPETLVGSEIQIFDVTSRLVHSRTIDTAGNSQLSLQEFSSGMYRVVCKHPTRGMISQSLTIVK